MTGFDGEEFARRFTAAAREYQVREELGLVGEDGPAFAALVAFCDENGIEELGIGGVTLAADPVRDS